MVESKPRLAGRGCKSCKSDRTAWINEQIAANRSDEWVSKALADLGIKIGRSSIMRHRHTCLGMLPEKAAITRSKPRKTTDTDDLVPKPTQIDIAAILDEVKARAENDSHIVSVMLRDIALDQLAIVRHGQQKYAEGTGINPVDDIRGLQAIHTLLREEAVVANLDIGPDDDVGVKAAKIGQGVIEGRISPANAERMLSVLHKQLELVEYREMGRELDELIDKVKST